MTEKALPPFVPTEELETWFHSRGIAFRACGSQPLGFGRGKPQYRLHDYPGPAEDETMGLFCEWHTENFFDVDTGPHVAIGLRGPVAHDPHRGRGLAIGILASRMHSADEPGAWVPLFRGCPDWPGGPSMFIEDFSRNDGEAPIPAWQLSPGRHLAALRGGGVYRIDIRVSRDRTWAGVWRVTGPGEGESKYRFMGQVACSDRAPGFSGTPGDELAEDRGQGSAFIGAGFADPDNRSWVGNIYLAHWKTDDTAA
jgi:hypothetical protein